MMYANGRFSCCNGCTDRQAGPNCHGFCERYLKEKAEYEAKKAEAAKKADIAHGIREQRFDAFNRMTRYRHYRSKYRKQR